MFNQLTQKDIDAMEAEIEERKLVIRPKLLEAVKEARAQGDLSENFEYYAAKKEKNKNESFCFTTSICLIIQKQFLEKL